MFVFMLILLQTPGKETVLLSCAVYMATRCGSKLVVCGTHLRLSSIETLGSSMMKTDASRDGDFTVVSEFQPWSYAQFKTFLGNCLSSRKLVKQFVLPEAYFPGALRQLECFSLCSCDVLCSWKRVGSAPPILHVVCGASQQR
jgi:hypothetical protein